jgi:hypothetical protein
VIDLAKDGRAVIHAAVGDVGFPEGVDRRATLRLKTQSRAGASSGTLELGRETVAVGMVGIAALAIAQPQ